MGRHYQAVTVNRWVEFLRRVQLHRTVKAVALMMATYARADGTQIYPGIATLAVACGMSYRTTLDSVSELERLGLVEQVSGHGRATGRYDTYRLTLAEDLLSLDVLSPDEFKDAAALMREKYRGKHRNACRGTARVEPVDNSETHAVLQHALVEETHAVSRHQIEKRMSFDDTKRMLFHAGGSNHGNLPALNTNLHAAAEPVSNRDVVGRPQVATEPCDFPGCAKGWVLIDDQLSRCDRCNAAERVA